MGMLVVRGPQDFAFVRPCGAQEALKVHAGEHVLHPPVAIFILHRGIKGLKAKSQNNGPYIYLYFLRSLIKVYGVILTNPFTDATFLLFKINTAFIDIRDKGNGLSVIYMDRLIIRYFLVKLIRVLGRAVFYTGRTGRAFVLSNISGLLRQGDLKVSCCPFYFINFSIGEDLYIWMPADLDQFRRQNSHGTVIGGESLVKLGHMPTDGR
jgi:hypothetical protein